MVRGCNSFAVPPFIAYRVPVECLDGYECYVPRITVAAVRRTLSATMKQLLDAPSPQKQ